jgi:hypothetical protein
MTRSTAALVAATAIAGLLATGCSSGRASASSGSGSASASPSSTEAEQPSVGELYKKVRAASLAAKSGRVRGSVTSGGEKVTVDIRGAVDGSNQRAKIGIGTGTAEILTVGGKYYMGGDAAFWTEQAGDPAAAKALVGKYVAVSSKDAKDIGDLSLGKILGEMFDESELSTLETLTSSVDTRTEGGKKVWVASDPSGAEIWVDPATEHLVKIVITGTDAGEVSFSEWDAAKTVTAPPASKVVSP